MQAHMAYEEEDQPNMLKEQLNTAAAEARDQTLIDHREMETKMTNMEANKTELNSLSKGVSNTSTETKVIKDKIMEAGNVEAERVTEPEAKLRGKEATLNLIQEEQNKLKLSAAEADTFLSDSKKRIVELESEIKRNKESEAKISGLYASQTSQLEQAMVLLEKFKLEIASLREDQFHGSELTSQESDHSVSEETERLQTELWVERENYARALERERHASLKAESLMEEMAKLKNELRLATEAEEKSKRAMDDLAMALKEVATQANQAKEQLGSTEDQLEFLKQESDRLKGMIKSTEERHGAVSIGLKKENEVLKNTTDRLRNEAEETLVAYTEKEIEFVKCIKRVEDERAALQQENDRLVELLQKAEEMHEKARDELQKLRDIFKQALNEANVAKEAAEIARSENSALKDSLAEKDKAMVALSQETERLRIREAAAHETIKDLKKLVSTSSGGKKELKMLEEKEHHPKKVSKKESSSIDKDMVVCTLMPKTFSFDLKELIPGLPLRHKDIASDDLEKDDELMDSIFDLVEPPENVRDRRRTTSLAFLDDVKCVDLEEEYEHEESSNSDDTEIDRGSQGKKRLLRRFGDLLRRRNQPCPSPKENQKENQKEHQKDHKNEYQKESQKEPIKEHHKEQKEHHKEKHNQCQNQIQKEISV